MKGIILLDHNYTYEGDIVDKDPHGKGIFNFTNGDRYVGECKFGKPDGFGKYTYKTGSTYTGFFSYGKINGIGTYEDNKNIYKGTWRGDKKHGLFYRTSKKGDYVTYLQKWKKNRLIEFDKIQYIRPEALQTIKKNPAKQEKKYQIRFKGNTKECMICLSKPASSTNDKCGHVVVCGECLKKCNQCPICRCPIGNIIELFIS